MTAAGEFGKVIDDANNLLDGFSSEFVSNCTKDINELLDDIGEDIRSEVAKVTDELKGVGFNSSDIPQELYDGVDFYTSVIYQVQFSF